MNGRWPRPMRVWRKKIGALGAGLDGDRDGEQERREDDQPGGRADDVHRALGDPVRQAEHRRRQAEQRGALERVDGGAAANDLEQPGHDVHLHAELVADTNDVQAGLVVGGEGEDDVLHAMGLQDVGQLRRRPEHGHSGQLVMQRQRIGVDEAHQLQAVAGLAHELAGDLLADQSGTDHHGVLLERGPPPQPDPGDAAAGREGDHGQQPEADHVAAVQRLQAGDLGADEDQPAGHGDAVEDRPDLVQGGVVGADAIAVVETVEPGQRKPHRDDHDQRDNLVARVDGQPHRPHAEQQHQQVGRQQRQAHEGLVRALSGAQDRAGERRLLRRRVGDNPYGLVHINLCGSLRCLSIAHGTAHFLTAASPR